MIEAVILSSLDFQTTRQKRIILAASNAEYVDFADNFAHSLLLVNVTNFILIPLDATAYRILSQAYPQHTVPAFPLVASDTFSNNEDDDDAKPQQDIQFGSAEFQQLTASRPNFLRRILELNYAIFYNDIDMVWKQNAWDVLDERIAGDYRHLDPLIVNPRRRRPTRAETESMMRLPKSSITTMLWHDGPTQICTCMMYILPTRENKDLLLGWEQEIHHGNYVSDQAAFVSYVESQAIVNISASTSTSRRHTVLFINDEQFPHGRKYMWEPQNLTALAAISLKRKDDEWTTSQNYSLNLINTERTIIVHNNWIKGKQAKKERFMNVGLWNPSGLLPQ